MKTAGSAIYANRHYLELYRVKHPERLCQTQASAAGDSCKKICDIFPDVHIHPSATIHHTAAVNNFYKYSAFCIY